MFNRIFQKGQIGNAELNNRLIMPAMGSSHGEADGKVGEELIEYYAARAKGGFGLIITEFVCVDPVGKALPGQLMIHSDEYIDGFKRLAQRIHEDGSKIFMQIQHSGRQTVSYFTGTLPVAPSPIPCPVNRELPRELTCDEIYDIVGKFGDAALRAKTAGFDGVEIHGAHGYLVAQFLSSYSNKRSDEFGGDIKGRTKFAVELIKNIKEKCGEDFPLIFRISGDERVENGRKIEETVIITKILEQAGADAIHVSTGVYASMPYMVPPANVPNGFNLEAASAVKAEVNIPVIAVGRITEPLMAEEVVSNGIADFVALGRASIADPEFPNKAKEGRMDEISPCVGCITRCNGAPGVDPDDHGVSCMINPFSGHERILKITKADSPKNIVIVGGGLGGLEAAWISAARGHKVTLFERGNKLGGQVIPGSVPPYKHELTKAIRYYTKMCEKYGADIQMGTEADVDKITALNPDEVILATGANPVAPAIPNEGIPVVQAVDVLNGKVMPGKKVLIVGGGLVGVETAEHLLMLNCQATVVEMLDKAGMELHPSIQYFIFKSLKKGGVDIYTNTKVEKFTKDGAVCSSPTGEVAFTGYDMAILAIGSTSYNPLETALKGKVKSIHLIGDAVKPRRIVDAVEEACRLAVKL
ncbi:MAG: NADH:flavin oxidoreductase/NADH oxidase [Oscillospiraceae bacterium]|nr:NADH:flavin oxidoreductase/NADH oxidase [Oscillospiraceae bacterium]